MEIIELNEIIETDTLLEEFNGENAKCCG